MKENLIHTFLLVAARNPWCSLASGGVTPISAPTSYGNCFVLLDIQISLLIRTPVTELDPIIIQYGHLQRFYF